MLTVEHWQQNKSVMQIVIADGRWHTVEIFNAGGIVIVSQHAIK